MVTDVQDTNITPPPAANVSQPGDQKAAETDQEEEYTFPSSWERERLSPCVCWGRAYFGSLVRISVVFPIVASVTTLFFYFSPGFTLPFSEALSKSNWYAPVYGFIFTLITTLLFAGLHAPFATVKRANAQSYGKLRSRYDALHARLGIKDHENGLPQSLSLREMKQATQMSSDRGLSESSLREAYAAFGNVCYSLCMANSGLQWTTSVGYNNGWANIHRAEEALIEVEPVADLVRGAIHDQCAIANSAMNNSAQLQGKLRQAITDLQPGALVYLDKILADKTPAPGPEEAQATPSDPKEVELRARGVLREVRHELNMYRDNLWTELLRARSHIMMSIALTGIVTHVLLCIVILLDYPSIANSTNSTRSAIAAATAFYLVGAIAGIFGRFYDEATTTHSIDDYGLFIARLIAVPLLSGLAGIGGVLVTVVLPVLSGQKIPDISLIFTLSSQYLLTAAIFGLAPNLLIKNFQQITQKYATDLESSKVGGKVAP